MTFYPHVANRIRENKNKALYAIATGRDLTKLEVKEKAALSMSTVISAVEELVKRGLVTYAERKGERGGKPHSVLNAHPMRRVYGISYKSGVLTAVACDLKGEQREVLSQNAGEGAPPLQSVLSLALALKERAPAPLCVALSLNCNDKEYLLKGLEDGLSVKALSSTNTAALAHLALWRGARLPLVAVGVGNSVKCALIDGAGYKTIDLGALPSPCLFGEDGTVASALSAARVEEVLRHSDYRANCCLRNGRLLHPADLGEYSRALAEAIASTLKTVDLFLAPREIVLFGEYLSEAFFERIDEKMGDKNLKYYSADRSSFALGSALVALIDGVFN